MKMFGLQINRVQKELRPVPSQPGARGIGLLPWISEIFPGAWQNDIEVTPEDLLQSPIAYSCVTLIANDFAKLYTGVQDKDDNGIWSYVENPAYTVLNQPNDYQNPIQFRQWWMMSKLRFGNTYALKRRDARNVVKKLYLLDPARVTPLVADNGSVYYQLGYDNLGDVKSTDGVVVPASEIIHDRMNCLYHQLCGIPPLYAGAIAAGIGLKIVKNAAFFFGNNSSPGGILVVPGNISDATAAQMKADWGTGFSGKNAGKVAVLAEGVTFQANPRQNATDSQMLEILKWTDEKVASVFHIPAYKVGVGSIPGNNNVEALQQDYYSQCLQILIEEFERCMGDGLGMTPNSRRVNMDLSGLLRMDSKTQMETIQAGITSKALVVNDGRKLLNLPPLDGGDTAYMQQQDIPLSEIKNNKLPDLSTPFIEPVEPAEPEPAEMTDEDKSLIAEARAIVATNKAIEFARKAALPESTNG